jgi:hypothetical protein
MITIRELSDKRNLFTNVLLVNFIYDQRLIHFSYRPDLPAQQANCEVMTVNRADQRVSTGVEQGRSLELRC